jgi:hypothetical protein
MDGLLDKHNSKGVWKERFCWLRNEYFLASKPSKSNGATEEVKEALDVREMSEVKMGKQAGVDILLLVMNDGKSYEYKGSR